MKKAQTKNITGLLTASLVLLFFGEGVFSASLYWPILLTLSVGWPNVYWYLFLFGLLLSLVSASSLGLASLVLVAGVFIFSRIQSMVGSNFLFLILAVTILGFVSDLVLSLSWSVWEAGANLIIVFLLWRLDLFENDLALRGAR